MKRKITAVITALIITCGAGEYCLSTAYAAEKPEISALAAVLISADTGEIIYSVNDDEKVPMASTTKIMSTLLCLESGDLYEEFTVDSEAIKVEGSSMGLREGDIVTKYALCCGMLLPSGNDAANAVAVKLAGSIEAFADMMNEKAAEMGLSRTYFVTPSGLEGEGHGSSAYDMALLARQALENELFREICSSEQITVEFGNPPYQRTLTNTNKLLSMYEGVYGVKTGFTDEAGRCLVSACERDGEKLICVTLNDRNDWNDHIAMYEYGFAAVESRKLETPSFLEISVAGSENETVTLEVKEPVCVTTSETDLSRFSYSMKSAPFVYAPIAQGEQLAELCVMYEGREVSRVPLCAAQECAVKTADAQEEKNEKNIFEKIANQLRKIFG